MVIKSEQKSAVRQVEIERFSVIASQPFENVIAKLEASLGHPNTQVFFREMAAAKTYAELERVVQKAAGPSGIMEFTRFDMGLVLRKESGLDKPHILRLVIGNPLIMKEMAKHVPDAASYAPVTILIDERPDGTHLSYDRMASYLSPYGSIEALKVARELDAKIEGLLTAASVGEAAPVQQT
jgi:uncharacterized protein (DUF302 family)